MSARRILALAGGVGAARFLSGLVRATDPERVTLVVNTGDDREFYGVHVSPDVDIVTYTLAGVVDPARGFDCRRKAAFGNRRKTLKNALAASGLRIDPKLALCALEMADIDPSRRAETLSVEEFIALQISLSKSLPAADD